MPAVVALVLAMLAVLLLGLGVLLLGAVQVVTARRRSAAVAVPLVATGVGLLVSLTAAIALVVLAGAHLTTTVVTFVR